MIRMYFEFNRVRKLEGNIMAAATELGVIDFLDRIISIKVEFDENVIVQVDVTKEQAQTMDLTKFGKSNIGKTYFYTGKAHGVAIQFVVIY